MAIRVILLFALLILSVDFGNAGSATWNLNPVDNNWHNPANWTPAIVPDEQATFDISNVTDIRAPAVNIDSVVFNPGASAFTFIGGPRGIAFHGIGIVNNSAVIQHFIVRHSGKLVFLGSASAGDNVMITNNGDGLWGSWTVFGNTSTAGNATIINEGAPTNEGYLALAGHTNFGDSANADNATIINNPGMVSGAKGGNTFIPVYAPGNLGTSTFIANAATVPGAQAGWVQF